MVAQALQLAQLGLGAFVIAALAIELARRPILVLYGILAAQAWSLLTNVELESTRVFGINVDVIDVVYVIALGAALIRMRRGPRRWQWALLGAMALTMYGALRGAIELGGGALLGFRAELYFVIPALFVTTLPRSMIPRLVRTVSLMGVALAVIAVGRWLALALGVWSPPTASGMYAIDRVINSSSALWVAFAAIAGVVALLREGRGGRPSMMWAATGLTLAVVLFAQHRTVWLSTVAMLAIALVITRRRWIGRASMAIAAAVVVVGIATLGPDDAGVVGDSLAVASSDVRTWEWRLQRWGDVWWTHAARGVPALIVGSGYGYAWVSGTVGVWEASPHNGYLQIAVRLGALGAAFIFVPYLVALATLWSARPAQDRIVWLWIVGTLVYYIPYSATALTGVVLGASLVLVTGGSMVVARPARASTGVMHGPRSAVPEPVSMPHAAWRQRDS